MSTAAEPRTVEVAAIDTHRYPGVRPFDEPDATRFFGRKEAADALLLRVLSVRLLLQFAPSGAGKTSLLRAGLFPKLREHGCFPFAIRLNHDQETLVHAAARSLRDAARSAGLDDPVIPENADTLWALMSEVQLWSRDVQLLTPVLVFDQFEEVFTLRDEAFRRRLASEMGELARGRAQGTSTQGQERLDLRIIISLREEYLGKLEEMSSAIPGLFQERLRLAPLSAAEAREAMVEPAKLPGDWQSPSFEFDSDCLDRLIDFIDGTSDRYRVIEPLTLQIVCQRAEAIAAAKTSAPRVLSFSDFGGVDGLDRLVHDHYKNELSKLNGSTIRRRAEVMFEQGLLDPSGKRLMLEQDEIARRYKLTERDLNSLVDSRLLRREPRGESVFYEISHDRLTEAIATRRSMHLPKWVWQALGAAALIIVFLVAVAAVAIVAKRQADQARARTTEALALLLGDDLAWRLREAGLSEGLQQVLDKAPVDPDADPLVSAMLYRRRGELELERGTLEEAKRLLADAAEQSDRAVAAGASSIVLQAERAQEQKLLGDILMDQGRVGEAESHYMRSMELWDGVTSSDDGRRYILEAAETRLAWAVFKTRIGDLVGAEVELTEAAHRVMSELTETYQRVQDRRSEDAFDLGHALKVYADAELGLAKVWWINIDHFRSARAVAAELLRLRPVSAQARLQFGTASANYGRYVAEHVDAKIRQQATSLFDEAARQFEDLTRLDPKNRRMMRDRAAVRMVTADGFGHCALLSDCRRTLRPEQIALAEAWALDSLGRFRQLANDDPSNLSLQGDIAWGLETQSTLMEARKAWDAALAVREEALNARQKLVVDERDIDARSLAILNVIDKGRLLAAAGKKSESLNTFDEALKEADGLPDGLTRKFRRRDGLFEKAKVLTSLGRHDQAAALTKEENAISAEIGEPWDTQSSRGSDLYAKGYEIHSKANSITASSTAEFLSAAQQFEEAAGKYRESLQASPGDPAVWSNLGIACSKAAEALQAIEDNSEAATAESKPVPPDPARHENALRCALHGAWLSWVLNDEVADASADNNQRGEGLQDLYVARRDLAMFLRLQPDPAQVRMALALSEEGVREAEALFQQENSNPSPYALFLVADSYFGLAMMRQESAVEGWEQAFNTAIGHGERVLLVAGENPKIRPSWMGDSYLHRWLGNVHNELANRLDAAQHPGPAASERKLGLQACERALKTAKNAEDRETAQTCIRDATGAEDKQP